MTTLAASLWSVPAERQRSEALRLRSAGITTFHWDHADGSMSRRGGLAAEAARAIVPVGAVSEAHLMMRDPRPVLDEWLPWCSAVAVHASQPFWRDCGERIVAGGSLPVLAVSSLEELMLIPAGWGVLVMAIVPGEAGGRFDERCGGLVAAAIERGHRSVGVDGSMTRARAHLLAARGATQIVSGTHLLEIPDPGAWASELATTEPETQGHAG